MSIYGSSLGPRDGTSFTFQNGRVPTEVAGAGITVDGKAAPVLYAQDGQVNFIAPWSVGTDREIVPVCVKARGETACLYAPSVWAKPHIFQWNGRDIVLNQDGSLNSSENPARRGSIVSVLLTGAGLLEGPLEDGAVAGLALQRLTSAMRASFLGDYLPRLPFSFPQMGPSYAADVLYGGATPGLVLGVTEVNVKIPSDVPAGYRGFSVFFTPPGRSEFTIATGSVSVAP